MPAPEVFPIDKLEAAATAALAQHGAGALQYTGGPGVQTLPRFIAERAGRHGLACTPEEVLITSGASQAIDLVGRVFLDPGDQVWAESPTFFGALRLFGVQGAEVRGFAVDEDGLDVDAIAAALAQARATGGALPKLFYTIPTFQNPTGAVLPLERRQQLMELSREYGFLILEDDAYGELCYEGELPPPIKALAPDRVPLLQHLLQNHCTGGAPGLDYRPGRGRQPSAPWASGGSGWSAITCSRPVTWPIKRQTREAIPWHRPTFHRHRPVNSVCAVSFTTPGLVPTTPSSLPSACPAST